MNTNGKPRKTRYDKSRDDLYRLSSAIQNAEDLTIHFVIDEDETVVSALTNSTGLAVKPFVIETGEEGPAKLIGGIKSLPASEIAFVSNIDEYIDQKSSISTVQLLQNLFEQLNRHRKLQQNIIFRISIDLVPFFQENAPDMWDWRSGLYMFDDRIEGKYRLVAYISDHLANIGRFHSFQEKQSLLKIYQILVGEYKKLPSADRIILEFNLLAKIGRVLYGLGEYQKATVYLDKQLEYAQFFDERSLLPEPLNNIAMAKLAQGEWMDAHNLLQDAWELADEVFRGASHPCKAAILSNLGHVQELLGYHQDGFLNCRKALRMCENKLGMRHPNLIPVLVKLSNVLRDQNKFEDALDQYRRALHIVERKLALDDPYISIILQNIGTTYLKQGKYEAAQRYFYRTLETSERLLGPEHPYLASQLRAIGITHVYEKKMDTALKYLYWAAELRQTRVGFNDPMVGDIYRDIGRVYQAQGSLTEARMCFTRAVDIYKSQLPAEHSSLLNMEKQLSEVESAMDSN